MHGRGHICDPKPFLSPEDYLLRERRAEIRSEYFRGEAFAMAGASFEHSLIKDNLAREIGNQLKEGPCRVVTSDMRVKISATGLYAYPDVVIVCGKPEFEDAHVDTLLNPKVIVEVLSDSTEKYDRGFKFGHYRQIPSLEGYVLIAQDRTSIDRYVRRADESWLLTPFEDPAGMFQLDSVAVYIPLREIYRGVTFPENAGR